MRNLKSIFGVLAALGPVVYCGGLLYYFLDLSGSMDEAVTNGLGPTVVGLGAVGLLFCIPLLVKIVWMFARPRAPGRGGKDASTRDGEPAFDADAVIARHMARRSAEAATGSPAAPEGGEPAPRATFGRKIR